MTPKPITLARPRHVQPRRWRNLAIAGAVSLAAAPAFAETPKPAIAAAAEMGATLWLAQAQGGEGGEAGAVAGAPVEVAYLAQLSIVEGHLIAARDLYAKGLVDEAIGLSYHPEAEMMDEVRSTLAAHGAADITPAMTAFSAALERAAALPEVDSALTAVQTAIAAAQAPGAADAQQRFAVINVVLRAAASEYTSGTEGGTVGDVMAYHESHAFIAVARHLIEDLAALPIAKTASEKALLALQATDEAYGDMSGPAFNARDPAILLAAAARVELIASSVR